MGFLLWSYIIVCQQRTGVAGAGVDGQGLPAGSAAQRGLQAAEWSGRYVRAPGDSHGCGASMLAPSPLQHHTRRPQGVFCALDTVQSWV
jgi:hypothetical protein